MPEAVTHADMLREQAGCPVCGAPLVYFERFGRHLLSGKARFSCGAAFASFENHPISPDRDCPNPARVAAAALNGEVYFRNRDAANVS